MVRKSISQTVLAFMLLGPGLAYAVITAHVDRQPVTLNESFYIDFESSESVGKPDFTPLEKELTILSTNQSSNFSIINGNINRSKKWTLEVLAKRAGQITIPAISFGRQRSQAFIIEVKQSATSNNQHGSDEVFFETDIQSEQPYVQEQVRLTIRLLLAVAVHNGSLTEPTVSGADAIIQKLGDDKQYNTQLGNRRYTVYERQYVVFPQASGALKIEPLTFKAQTGSGSFFDQFRKRPKTIIKHSKPITLTVKAIPTTYTGGQWLPTKRLELKEAWSETPPEFQVGKPITRTINLLAEGLTASQLPEIAQQISTAFKQYPDQPVLRDEVTHQGISGNRVEKIAIIPQVAGEFTLPAIQLTWWNIDTDQQAYAMLPERVIQVLSAAGVPPVPGNESSHLDEAKSTADAADEPITAKSDLPIIQTGNPKIWMGLSIFLGTGWLLTIGLWWRLGGTQNKAVKSVPTLSAEGPSTRHAIAQLKRACANNDPNQAKEAVLQWARCRWPDKPPTSIGEVAKRIGGDYSLELETLNRALYRDKQTWHGKPLWTAFTELEKQPKPSQMDNTSALEPLYRL